MKIIKKSKLSNLKIILISHLYWRRIFTRIILAKICHYLHKMSPIFGELKTFSFLRQETSLYDFLKYILSCLFVRDDKHILWYILPCLQLHICI